MVAEGGARPPHDAIQPRKRKRWPSSLYMDGPELVKFTLDVVPPMVERILGDAGWTADDVDFYLLHQATTFMLNHLRERMEWDDVHTPEAIEDYGNTVSSTMPILMHDLRACGAVAAWEADAHDRLWRRALLGRLRLDGDLGGEAGPGGAKKSAARGKAAKHEAA